jgi:hypothetical protein
MPFRQTWLKRSARDRPNLFVIIGDCYSRLNLFRKWSFETENFVRCNVCYYRVHYNRFSQYFQKCLYFYWNVLVFFTHFIEWIFKWSKKLCRNVAMSSKVLSFHAFSYEFFRLTVISKGRTLSFKHTPIKLEQHYLLPLKIFFLIYWLFFNLSNMHVFFSGKS